MNGQNHAPATLPPGRDIHDQGIHRRYRWPRYRSLYSDSLDGLGSNPGGKEGDSPTRRDRLRGPPTTDIGCLSRRRGEGKAARTWPYPPTPI